MFSHTGPITQILAINGQDMSHAKRDQAMEALRSTGDYIALLVRSNVRGYAAFRQQLRRNSNAVAHTLEVSEVLGLKS